MNKNLATQIAFKLTDKKQKEVDRLNNETKKYLTDMYLATIPKEITNAFKKNSEYFNTSNTVRLDGNGFRWENFTLLQYCICNSNNNCFLKVDPVVYAKVKELNNKYQDAKNKLNSLRSEIETALNGLKTFSQIQKHLPEAIPYLPKSTTMELMVNFEVLRKNIA